MPERRLLAITVVALAALLAAAHPAAAGLANSAWPMFQHDAQHTGRTDVSGPQGPTPQIPWFSKTRSRLRGAVAVGPTGTVFVPNGKNPLSAFDPVTGAEIWQSSNHQGGHADRSQPAVSDTGVVYQGARDNDLWACDAATGAVNWRFHVPHDGDVTTPPTIAADGTIYMGSEALGAGWFYAMDPSGVPKWPDGPNVSDGKVVLQGSLKNASPALSHDEQTVFISIKQEAIALDADTGDQVWRVPIADKGYGSRHPNYAPAVSNDGSRVYFQSREGLWALDPATGAPIWLFVPFNGEQLLSAVSIGADDTVYVGASRKKSRHFYALDPADGSILWTHAHTNKGKFSNNQAAIGADGKVYVALGRMVFCFDGAGDGLGGSNLIWSLSLPGKIDAGVVIGGPGLLYVGAGKNLWQITD